MYPASFDYHTPGSVQEAISLLGKLRDDAKLLAGGHSLIPMMKLRLAQPKHLIDLRKVPGLAGIREDGGSIALGAMTTHWQVESSKLLQAKIPVVSDAAGMIGDPQVRNLGTIGGSLAHADPAADMPAVMIALGVEFVIEGVRGRRTVKVDDFFKGLMMTAVGPDEILVEIRVPVPPAGSGAAYLKFPHPASRFAVVGVCAALTVDGKGICTKAGVGVTGAGTRAVRAKGVEAGLAGKALDHAAIEAAAAKAADGVDVQADLQGSAEYKSHLLRVHARRAIEAALGRAKGGK
ncbi:MAG: carbon monoxide dehydrogenase [Candidatus Rokuibacteriota bacterium]|nr:MAG: carbon monoxide dehydrogenase [Candidatus Rokubacteria bacterium]